MQQHISMTPEEKTAMKHLVEFCEQYRALPESDDIDVAEVALFIHQIQGLFALRIARRADPDYWRKPE